MKQREYEKMQQKLYEEFKVIDLNQDGSITLDEIISFLEHKVYLLYDIYLFSHQMGTLIQDLLRSFLRKWMLITLEE